MTPRPAGLTLALAATHHVIRRAAPASAVSLDAYLTPMPACSSPRRATGVTSGFILERGTVLRRWHEARDLRRNFAAEVHRAKRLLAAEVGPIKAALVYVNTLMVQDVLADDEWAMQLTDADRRGLTPLFWTHVAPYGEVKLDMSSRLILTTDQHRS